MKQKLNYERSGRKPPWQVKYYGEVLLFNSISLSMLEYLKNENDSLILISILSLTYPSVYGGNNVVLDIHVNNLLPIFLATTPHGCNPLEHEQE